MARILRREGDVSRRSLWQKIKDAALMDLSVVVRGVGAGSLEQIEELLLEADFGVPVSDLAFSDLALSDLLDAGLRARWRPDSSRCELMRVRRPSGLGAAPPCPVR